MGHVEPDGDAVGAMAAFAEYLRSNNKTVRIVCRNNPPVIFDFLGIGDDLRPSWPEDDFDVIVLLDNGDFRRTGFIDEIKQAQRAKKKVINIDHHPKNDIWKIANVNYADPEASSTCEVIFQILQSLEQDISPTMATSLLTGVYYDTGGFRHQNTSKRVFEISAELMRAGARLKKITDCINNSKSPSVFRIWGIALNRLRISKKYGLSISVLTLDDLHKTGATEEDVAGLVNLLNSAPESRATLLLYETKDAKIKGSLRTEYDDIDLSALARLLGGGGHKKAAGFTIEGKIEIDGNDWKII